MAIIRELWNYAKIRKKFWLLPIIVLMLILGLVVVVGQGSVVTPFIYAIF